MKNLISFYELARVSEKWYRGFDLNAKNLISLYEQMTSPEDIEIFGEFPNGELLFLSRWRH